MKIVFFGTPDFAVPSLNALINSKHQVVAVVTQPDKSVGRSGKLVFSPVKELALKHNIPVLQYPKIKLAVEELKNLNADVFVSAAYGQIFNLGVLTASKHGMFNVHGSLLPKLRGAAPIQWSIINGDTVTGITILRSDVGMDDGDIILKKEVSIGHDQTAGELFSVLADLGAVALMEAIEQLDNGTITYTPQDHSIATKCSMLNKEDNKIDFNLNANQIVNLVRGLNPWPVAEFKLLEGRIKVYSAKVCDIQTEAKIGEVICANNKQGLVVACNGGAVEIVNMQPENSKVMAAKSYLNGKTIKVGQIVNE